MLSLMIYLHLKCIIKCYLEQSNWKKNSFPFDTLFLKTKLIKPGEVSIDTWILITKFYSVCITLQYVDWANIGSVCNVDYN